MGLYTTYETNASMETEGVVLTYGENDKGKVIGIKVARAGGANKAFQRVMAAKTRPYRRQLDQGTMSVDTMEKLLREVYAETVVLAWENVEDRNGNPLECSVENIIQVFTDLPDLFTDLRAGASDIAAFRADLLDAVVKN